MIKHIFLGFIILHSIENTKSYAIKKESITSMYESTCTIVDDWGGMFADMKKHDVSCTVINTSGEWYKVKETMTEILHAKEL